eukprot:TRINITY_DN3594_c0_g2_i1.p1 TRINITY_DN3594_c0_g2~~TRINITY_DN3594_c0_g2_i1.p1  ORF type:complete len:245 (+),score=83.34 TRINITY_DN3594_c0_g2_i1:96-737(+)
MIASKQSELPIAEVGQLAPVFSGIAWDSEVGFKNINLRDYKGSYVVLFFYSMDFGPVCTGEILEFSRLYDAFKATQCEVVGCSGDSQYVHMENACKPVEKGGVGLVKFPLLSDLTHEIATAYGAYVDFGKYEGSSLRSTYIIDREGIIRHLSQNDLPVGRNVEEVLRLVQGYQHTDKYGEVCPSKWKKGGRTMVPEHKSEVTKKYWEEEFSKA